MSSQSFQSRGLTTESRIEGAERQLVKQLAAQLKAEEKTKAEEENAKDEDEREGAATAANA